MNKQYIRYHSKNVTYCYIYELRETEEEFLEGKCVFNNDPNSTRDDVWFDKYNKLLTRSNLEHFEIDIIPESEIEDFIFLEAL